MKEESLQAENIIFFRNLDICCQKIAEQIENNDIASWKNSDYIKLSGLLYRKTKVHLGENTLKRIFGKVKTSIRYYPQKATRDALAKFIDYRDWQDFERINSLTLEKSRTNIESEVPAQPEKISPRSRYQLTIIFVMCFILIAISFWVYKSTTAGASDIRLICLNPNGQSPHSALFKLQSKLKGRIHFSDYKIDFADLTGRKKIFNDSLVNHYYESPGRYFPVLYCKNKAIDSVWVYLQTKGWDLVTSVEHDTTRVYPVNHLLIQHGNKVSVSTLDLYRAGVDTTKTFFASFANVKPTGISADNFEMNVYIKSSSPRPGVRCSQADINVLGENSYHYINLIKPECVVWSSLKFSEVIKDGSQNDLRMLGHDLSEGKKIKLRIANKTVTLFVNDKIALKTSYKKPIGKFMGIKIRFAGIGSFENFELHDLISGEKF